MRFLPFLCIAPLLASCAAPTVPQDEDKASWPQQHEAGALWIPSIGAESGHVIEQTFCVPDFPGLAEGTCAELHRFHTYEVMGDASLLRLRIDTHGSFDPVFLVEVLAPANEDTDRVHWVAKEVLVAPTTEGGTVYELSYRNPRASSGIPVMRLLVSSREAYDEQTVVSGDARYRIETTPIPQWQTWRPEVVGLSDDDALFDGDETTAVTQDFRGSYTEVRLELDPPIYPTLVHLAHETDATCDRVRVEAVGESQAVELDRRGLRMNRNRWVTDSSGELGENPHRVNDTRFGPGPMPIQAVTIGCQTGDTLLGDLELHELRVEGIPAASASAFPPLP